MPEMKTARLEVGQWLLFCYESESNDFLYSIIMGDKSWVHHYEVFDRKVFCLMTLPATKIHYKTFIYLTIFHRTLVLKAKAKLHGSKQHIAHTILRLTPCLTCMYDSSPISYLQFGQKYWNRICFILCTIIRRTSILQMIRTNYCLTFLQYCNSTIKKAKCRSSIHTQLPLSNMSNTNGAMQL